ncbi:VWA domain-containing protein [Marinobacter orientalis]|uniref:VWA domain-containing protein n=1 Tax=Marinobacter orientalis TaxID=1928859 RepID=A0A7Y0RED1_9GAMM|nr:VWA domain-containing protein [Marinobacter orientalis]NMT64683.1 VWA domain-containing protein [Marinobacter orientalis]TGX48282.1 VWA domain-containing protein [Marinobacter orientalis]
MADFHFLRPLWLLLLLAALFLPLLLRRFHQSDSGWSRIIPANLLRPMISQSGAAGARRKSPLLPATAAVVVLAIALAGPAWRQAPTPLQQQNDSLVVVLDLSLSMLATDVEPDRLTRAKRKIRDILKAREGALTALVVYAADAHVVTPLTDDRNTIEGMLDVLEPVIMPATGNRADLGVQRGLELLEQGAPGSGRLLLIADDVGERYRERISDRLAGSRFALSTLTVGTAEGGPIPLARHGFIRDNGDIVITRANPDAMESLAERNGGNSHELTLTDDDIRALELRPIDSADWQASAQDLTVNRWQDDGYWLLWLAAPLALIGWRRGAMIIMLFAILPLTPRPAMALDWDSLWSRQDQRAPELIEQDPGRAAEILDDPAWRGSALYREGDYESAAKAFSRAEIPSAEYNRGNALARAGELEQALEAYEKALEKNPDNEDARFNHDLVKQLLEQQQQNQSDDEGDESSDQGGDQQQQDNQQNDQGGPDSPNQQGDSSDQAGDQQDNQQQQGEPDGDSDNEEQQPSQGQEDQRRAEGTEGDSQESPSPAELETSPLSQGQEQWLRRVPDNPGGLLRRKFLQQYQERETPSDEGDTPW